MVCGVIVLPALGVWTLRKNLAEVVPYEAESLTRERRRMLLRDMGRPVFCVCAIGFVWKMIGYVVPQGNLGSFEGIMLGMSCATLVVAAIEQGDREREEAQRALALTCGTQRGIRKGAADAAKRELDQALSDGGFASCEEARAAELSNLTSRAFLRKSKPIRPITLKRSPHVSESRRWRRLRPMRKVSKKRKLRRDLSPHGLPALQ